MWIIVAVIVVLIIAIFGIYNSVIRAKNRVDEAWSDIDVQLKRRHDLIPNLVESVKGYAAHEKTLFEDVSKARAAAMGATSLDDKDKAENQLSGTLKSLFAVAENYPDLKANQNFLQLQGELTDSEDKIQAARRFYNGSVRDYNIKIQTIPASFFAGMMGFKAREFFGAEESDKALPKVNFQG